MQRRAFIAKAATGAVAVTWSALSAARVSGANDRIAIALVGCGIEGMGIAGFAAKSGLNADIVAVCDVYEPHLTLGRETLRASRTYKDFRRVLEDKDVDAVMVATPDHWHGTISVLACQAGKDVYCEKPLAHNILEGRKLVNTAHRYNRVVQMGNQGRTALHIAEAVQIIRSGQLGEVRFARVWDTVNGYPASGVPGAPTPGSAPPPGLDWDFFLGPAPAVPFNDQRFRDWRSFYDYGGGLMTDMGVHLMDTVQRALGCDAPLSVHALGKRYLLKGGDVPDILQVTYDYPDFVLAYESRLLNGFGMGNRSAGLKYHYPTGEFDRPHGMAFFGTNGTLFADPDCYEIFPETKGKSEYRMERKLVQTPDGTNGKPLHVKNWIECLRSRKAPNSEVEIGHRASITAHLGNIAWKVGKTLYWDRETEDFKDCPEASKLRGREPRQAYAWI